MTDNTINGKDHAFLILNKLLQYDTRSRLEENPISIEGTKMLIDDFVSKNNSYLCVNIIEQDKILDMQTINDIELQITQISRNTEPLYMDMDQAKLSGQNENRNRNEQIGNIRRRIDEMEQQIANLRNKQKYLNSDDDIWCNFILRFPKQPNKLNFFIVFWDKPSLHSSIVLNISDEYFFLDSLGASNQRYPTSRLVNNETNSFNPHKIFIMASCLQKDSHNCRSFCLEIIKNFTNTYKLLGLNRNLGFKAYLKQFFCYQTTFTKYRRDIAENSLITVVSEQPQSPELFITGRDANGEDTILCLLPSELLKTCQSFNMLKMLKQQNTNYIVNTVDSIDEQINDNREYLKNARRHLTFMEKAQIIIQNIKLKKTKNF